MATAANPPPGATPANGSGDPFTSTPAQANSAALRFAPFDTEHFSAYSTNSPTQAKRALEAHLKDTDRRIQDASRLGTTLLQQRKDLSARLKDVEQVQQDNEVPADLRKKLADLEKEYNEVGKESARAFLPKSRAISTGGDPSATPSALTGSGRESPTKVTAPSRRQRNQSSNRVHDIEFATEISTSLLAQVRQLQAALSEKEETLRETNTVNAQLEAEAAGMVQRIKHMDENEQRYKDENWNLETRLQELESSHKDLTDKESRVTQSLMFTQSEKAAAQRDLDDLKVSHEKLNEEHAGVKKQQEADMHGLRRDVASHETERTKLEKRIEELNSQNTELAKAVSYRWNQPSAATDTDFVSADEEHHTGDSTPEHSEPASPVKGTPRHGMLESETLKSSLNHAHRMIQNLKNNIHREKTEKIELKRMLQDARDELESKRNDGGIGANMARKRRSETENAKFKKPARPAGLGANRSSTTDILEDDPDWEEHDGAGTPSKSRGVSAALGGAVAGAAGTAALDHAFHGHETDSTDPAFETATERGGTTTDAFETSREDNAVDDDELTETETNVARSGTVRRHVTPLVGAKKGDRRSFMSTASTSGDEDDSVRTPVTAQQSKYRLRMNRSSKRGRVGDLVEESPNQQSPASSTGTPQPAGQSLGDELDALDEDSVDGTPSRFADSAAATPETQRQVSAEPESPEQVDAGAEDGDPTISSPVAMPDHLGLERGRDLTQQANAAMLAHEFAVNKPTYADAGVMTDPWEPKREFEPVVKKQGFRERAEEVVGGALAGFGLGHLGGGKKGQAGAESADKDPIESDNFGAETEGKSLATTSAADNEILSPAVLGPKDEQIQEPKSLHNPELIRPSTADASPQQVFHQSQILSQETRPVANATADSTYPLAAAAPLASKAEEKENLDFSPVLAQHFEPENAAGEKGPLTPLLPKRSSRRMDAMYDDDGQAPIEGKDFAGDSIPGTEGSRVGASFFGASVPHPLVRSRSQSLPPQERVLPNGVPTLLFDAGKDGPVETRAPTGMRAPLEEVDPNAVSRNYQGANEDVVSAPKPLQIRKPMADGGSQTEVSGDDIDKMLRNKAPIANAALGGVGGAAIGAAVAGASMSPNRPTTAIGPNGVRRSIDGTSPSDVVQMRAPKRPSSAGSMRNKATAIPPPLPENHNEKIAAAQQTPGTQSRAQAGTMGPPLMPASAYKQNRPRTPVDTRSMSRDGTTPRAARTSRSQSQLQSPSGLSRRTSVSSFASELDERFGIQQGQVMYPDDVKPATDPRMIQAITQTMIGEYLWKYTRKAGRSETSSTRHRRFFWIHPYTRTLYWSEKDPSTAGRDMLKAKSVAIEAVRVVSDDNAYPPGLHRKSLVVVTPGREIVFTAPTGQRHETWFNALSYLLLRTEAEKVEAEDTINQEDIDEFNPGFGSSFRRSISRMTGGGRSQSRVSLSSYNSRTTRTSSPQKRDTANSSLAQRQSTAAAAAVAAYQKPTPTATNTSSSRYSTMRESNGGGGRLSSLTSRFKPTNAQRGSMSSNRGRTSHAGSGSEIYDASVAAESAEDLRAVIERQEHDADRLENVRACCDGKHDVGSLSRKSRHGSLGSRLSHTHAHHTHALTHAHPRAEPILESSKPRRGE